MTRNWQTNKQQKSTIKTTKTTDNKQTNRQTNKQQTNKQKKKKRITTTKKNSNHPPQKKNNIILSISRPNPLSYFSFQPVLHDTCNKGRGMCYPVCGIVHIKEPLLLIYKSRLCGGNGFPFSLSEWSLTICLTPYNRR